MRTGRHTVLVVVVALYVALSASAGFAVQPESAVPDTVDLAVVPFANNTGQSDAHALLMPRLERLLTERGLTLVTSGELRPLLREHRVRSRGWIGKHGARLIGRETGTGFLLLGSWDVLKTSGNLEIGVSLRILDLENMVLIHAVSVAGTGEDAVSWLDLGRVEDLELLADSVLERAVDELIPYPEYAAVRPSWRGCNHVAVIPLDDYSATEHAGDIVTNILLSGLLSAGYFVVEPGFVRELGLAREVMNRGGVDCGSAQAILDSLGACQVITGAVQRFDPSRGLPTVSVPRFADGFRASSTRNGTLYLTREIEGTGGDDDGIFQLGRVHAITPLIVEKMNRFIDDLLAANRKDIIHGPKKH